MLVNIGQRQRPNGLVGALLECHDRIRSFSGLAVAVGDREELAADQLAEACTRIARYFSQGLPLHVQDEEQSILPRLVGRAPALDDTLAEMRAQHASHEAPLGELIVLCGKLPQAPDAALRSDFRAVAQLLDRELRRHLELEETRLFPALPVQLGEDEQAAILAELRARRV